MKPESEMPHSRNLFLPLCLWLTACPLPQSNVSDRVRELEKRMVDLTEEQRQIARQALCPREVRRLLEDGRRECKVGTACSNPEIGLFVNDADPTHQGRFLTLMDSQDHRAFFFKAPPPAPAVVGLRDPFYIKQSQSALGEKQIKQLRRLLQPRLLSTTQFLVVSHPGENRDNLAAERRGSVVIDQILDLSAKANVDLKPERILHWIYPFALQRGEKLRAEDRPPPGASLNQSTWVFRVDC